MGGMGVVLCNHLVPGSRLFQNQLLWQRTDSSCRFDLRRNGLQTRRSNFCIQIARQCWGGGKTCAGNQSQLRGNTSKKGLKSRAFTFHVGLSSEAATIDDNGGIVNIIQVYMSLAHDMSGGNNK